MKIFLFIVGFLAICGCAQLREPLNSASIKKEFLVFAHRGAMGHEPENTLLAFEKALELGAPWIELDVRRSMDGQAIVIHDRELKRTTSGAGFVEEHPASYFKTIDAGKDQHVPTLQEVFSQFGGRIGINVEIKDAGLAASVEALISEQVKTGHAHYEQFLVSSFNHRELKHVKELEPKLRVAPLLYGLPVNDAELAESLDAYSVNVSKEFIDRRLVRDAHERGLRVFVYTVNSVEELDEVLRLGVNGVFSDYPDRMLQHLHSQEIAQRPEK